MYLCCQIEDKPSNILTSMSKLLFTPLSKFFCLFAILFCLGLPARAFLGVHETAEILPPGQYRVGLIPQFYIGQKSKEFYSGTGGGSDHGAFLDMWVDRDINARLMIGTGSTDFWASGSVKWAPYPDFENQPAIGLRGRLIYVREASSNFYNTQITPIISKKYQLESALLIPYVGVPVTFIYEKSSHNYTALQLAAGSEWVIQKDFQAGAELGLDLANTTTTLSIYLNFEFDETKGFKK